MTKSRKGLNKYQKAAHRPGEHRVRRDEIDELLILADSDDADDRLVAADNLCPCHVRRRLDEVWDALYRMMEDPDVRVRRAAWHTLEDGGCPTDDALDRVFERALTNETDVQVRRFVEMFAAPQQREKERMALQLASYSAYDMRGKCDFCSDDNVSVRRDFDTEIPAGGTIRFALVCEPCAQ